ncbi:hypothetical protein C8J57DRAFT_1311769 [Mycena rebaudengoi]|nr:hypothetical protein C8J57DRAFT_1311769 [Mycena rebaudengoi]
MIFYACFILLCMRRYVHALQPEGYEEPVVLDLLLQHFPFKTTHYSSFRLFVVNPDIQLGHVHKLMVGNAEDLGNNVADIIGVNSFVDFRTVTLGYSVPASIPLGDYHIRLTGTMYNVSQDDARGTPLGSYTLRSQTFPITQDYRFTCTAPKWTPMQSVDDPGFSHVHIVRPHGGQVYFLKSVFHIDLSFQFRNMPTDSQGSDVGPMTVELVNTATGASVSARNISMRTLKAACIALLIYNIRPAAG